MSTFAEIMLERAQDDHPGLRAGDRTWTWAEVTRECAERAALLREFGVAGKQTHIGVLLENVPDYVFWIGAAALSGAVIVGINPTRRGEELAGDIRHTDCAVLITESRMKGLLDGVDHGVPAEAVLDIDSEHYAALLAARRGSPPPDELPPAEAILLLLFSSGSTGAPKAVICTQGRFGFLAGSLTERTELTRSSVTYLCMPLFHGNSAMMNLAPAWRAGATVCLARKFSASGFADDIHRYGVTFVNYVGRALSYVLAQPEGPRDAESTLELALGTEASVPDITRFAARFGCRVSEGYGLSEGVLRINRTPESPPGALGLPVAGADVRVLNEETGAECPRARIGEHGKLLNAEAAIGQIVAIGKAAAFEGYYKNPGAYAERVRGEDFWTGDLAYRDAEGYFYFAGRSSDWLRVDSENFSAAPVERILQRWNRVTEAFVYAVPDPRTGDQVMCALRLREGAEFVPGEFAEFLDEQPDLGTKWRPRFVRIVAEVPTTASNKVAKAVLRKAAWNTQDPVFFRAGTSRTFEPFGTGIRERIEAEFGRHGRGALLPGSEQ
ncbi:AMP-binding protein [Saccharomonospora sp. NPDC006951]